MDAPTTEQEPQFRSAEVVPPPCAAPGCAAVGVLGNAAGNWCEAHGPREEEPQFLSPEARMVLDAVRDWRKEWLVPVVCDADEISEGDEYLALVWDRYVASEAARG